MQLLTCIYSRYNLTEHSVLFLKYMSFWWSSKSKDTKIKSIFKLLLIKDKINFWISKHFFISYLKASFTINNFYYLDEDEKL